MFECSYVICTHIHTLGASFAEDVCDRCDRSKSRRKDKLQPPRVQKSSGIPETVAEGWDGQRGGAESQE